MKSKSRKHQSAMKTTIISAIVAAIVGSVCTVLLTITFNWFSKPPDPTKPPKPLNLKAVELLGWYDEVDNLELAEHLFKMNYYNKYVEWEGILKSNYTKHYPSFVRLEWDNVAAYFTDKKNATDALNVEIGERVVVKGKITRVKYGIVRLDDCCIVSKGQ